MREFVEDDNGWTPFAPGLSVIEVSGDHDSMVLEPNVRVLAARIRGWMQTLNARCFEAGIDAFTELLERIEAGTLVPRAQDRALRSWHSAHDRPPAAARLDWRKEPAALVLRGLGVGPGMPVGLCTRRSEHLVIGALAILKAGGAYVPMDPAYPADRLALCAEDSGAAVIVTEAALAGTLPDARAILALDTDPHIPAAPATAPESGVTPADLAYLIYTSGSTGRPKGVMIEHRSVANVFAGMDARIPRAPGDTRLAVTSPSFDISLLELFCTLARGFRVVLMGDDDRALVSHGATGGGRRLDVSLTSGATTPARGRRTTR
jgi:hypothetical protein